MIFIGTDLRLLSGGKLGGQEWHAEKPHVSPANGAVRDVSYRAGRRHAGGPASSGRREPQFHQRDYFFGFAGAAGVSPVKPKTDFALGGKLSTCDKKVTTFQICSSVSAFFQPGMPVRRTPWTVM